MFFAVPFTILIWVLIAVSVVGCQREHAYVHCERSSPPWKTAECPRK
jgi:hypothetical protein